MTFGTTKGHRWSETLPTEQGASFTGRTFCRFHIVGDPKTTPSVCEIWATSDHAVEGHAHESDELLYVLSGAINVNGRLLGANEVVFIPRGSSYRACVAHDGGSHVLRIELPSGVGNP